MWLPDSVYAAQSPTWTGTYGMPRPNIAAMAVFPEDPQGEFMPSSAPLPAAPAPAPPMQQSLMLPTVSLKPKDPRAIAQQQQLSQASSIRRLHCLSSKPPSPLAQVVAQYSSFGYKQQVLPPFDGPSMAYRRIITNYLPHCTCSITTNCLPHCTCSYTTICLPHCTCSCHHH